MSLPGGFQDRLFESWITWDKRIEANGQQTYIIAFYPLEKYKGTHHKVDGAEKMQGATSRGIYIIKELTDNTCEWTRFQQADLKIAVLPANVMDLIVKQQLDWANEEEDKFKRNGKEVDREVRTALAEVITARRGVPLMEDQVEVLNR